MRMLIRIVRLAAVLVVVAAAPAAVAGEWRDYDPAAFAEAQDAGQTIFVAVHANWCGVCRRQMPILESLVDEAAFEDAVTFRVDYDTERDFLREHRVRYQSTLIVFRGRAEIGRSLGELDGETIRELFLAGL